MDNGKVIKIIVSVENNWKLNIISEIAVAIIITMSISV
tara:strand:+ start:1403 stop:1516 length:114 start_codon:yes stop_codon:yes gene_type:complete